MIFFSNENYQPWLCIPVGLRNFTLREAHESPFKLAHTGPERLWQSLSSRFYWKRMKTDIVKYCRSCDICQKTKAPNFTKFGMLIPNPIPSRPYQSISMVDFIVNLPWTEGFNAIYVVVDRLTKHASFKPTTTGLVSEGFAILFFKHIVCRFGLPESIVMDRDPRWTSDFWLSMAKALQTKMSLSSSHHPQHDGQTEVVNKLLTMMCAFITCKKDQWALWLHLLEFAYNSSVHSSIGTTPFHLLLGFHPRTALDFIGTKHSVTTYDYSYLLHDTGTIVFVVVC